MVKYKVVVNSLLCATLASSKIAFGLVQEGDLYLVENNKGSILPLRGVGGVLTFREDFSHWLYTPMVPSRGQFSVEPNGLAFEGVGEW